MATTGKWARAMQTYFCAFLLLSTVSVRITGADTGKDDDEAPWKKKDVRDYNDADLERLFEQWEEDDDPLEEDELPEWKRPQPKIDLNAIDPNDPEAMLHMTKKGRTLMMFATVAGEPVESETEDISRIWQGSLFNANYDLQRYIVGSNRVLFVLKDGSKAWEIKDYLIQQERCQLVTIEGKDFHGKGSPEYQDPTDNSTKKPASSKKTKDTKKKNSNSIKSKKVEL